MPQRIEDENLDQNAAAGPGTGEAPTVGSSTVIAALEQIALLVDEARTVPLSANVIVNKAEIVDLVEQAKEALPEDLLAADAVVADADAVLDRADSAAEVTIAEANAKAKMLVEDARDKADMLLSEAGEEAERRTTRAKEEAATTQSRARAEAERILEDARRDAENLIAKNTITKMAEEKARTIIANANKQAEELTVGADQYVADSLSRLSQTLRDLLKTTDGGLRTVEDRSGLGRANIDLDSDD